MINRLINMNVLNINEPLTHEGKYSIQEYATSFINGMGDTQKMRFKKMLENNIECGMSVAKNYGINYDEFIKEVKNQLSIKE